MIAAMVKTHLIADDSALPRTVARIAPKRAGRRLREATHGGQAALPSGAA
jgi:hypothetical protein